MVKCPRCEQLVDETVRTTCPVCYTPLPQAAPSAPQQAGSGAQSPATQHAEHPIAEAPEPEIGGYQPTMQLPQLPADALRQAPPPHQQPNTGYAPPTNAAGGKVRIAFTGEVVDDNANNNAPPPNYVSGTPAQNASAQHRPAGQPPRSQPAGYRPVEAPSGGGNKSAPIVAIIALIAVLGAGGWWFTHRSNPKDNAKKVLEAVTTLDWKTIYNLTDLNEEAKKKYPDADSFAKAQNEGIDKVPAIKDLLKSIKFSDIGEPVTTDTGVSIPYKVTMSFMGQTKTQEDKLAMKNVGGVWKVDASRTGSAAQLLGGMGGPGK